MLHSVSDPPQHMGPGGDRVRSPRTIESLLFGPPPRQCPPPIRPRPKAEDGSLRAGVPSRTWARCPPSSPSFWASLKFSSSWKRRAQAGGPERRSTASET
jgi:hypothetical protein